jgi:glycosyltransferase involved in cell wall biosynthesis
MVLLSHPTGNVFVRAALGGLLAAGRLHTFYTTIVAPPEAVLRWLPRGLRRQLTRRRYDGVPRQLVRTWPWRESVRLTASVLGLSRADGARRSAGVDAVYGSLDRHVAARVRRLPPDTVVTAVYCYEDGADRTFLSARDRGIGCVYDLPIAYWQTTQRLLHEEADRLPAWRRTLHGIDDSEEKLERKDRELQNADTVVVPSQFVLQSLPAEILAGTRCVMAPFGSPPPQPEPPTRRGAPTSLRVLFAGAMTQRKGLADLFAAMRMLNRSDVELVVMGPLMAPMEFYRREYAGFIYELPRPHAEVLELMQTCDVLALPAIVEGRALVQQEALACGLPLVVTQNAGGEDLIDEGRTGFLIPIRAPEELARRIAWLADHRSALPEMRIAARRKAAETGWHDYAARVCDAAETTGPAGPLSGSGVS